MSKVLITDTTMTDIADAIREKLGTSDTMLPSEMPDAIGSISGGDACADFSEIGYTSAPTDVLADIAYSKTIQQEWDATTTDMDDFYSNRQDLVYLPLIDTSNVESCDSTFSSCINLISVPALDFSKCTYFDFTFSGCTNLKDVDIFTFANNCSVSVMFTNCPNLTDKSLDNILKMCINLTSQYTPSERNLKDIMGINDVNYDYSTARLQALPSYQDFTDAGWTLE